jgi:hypothetical protein
LQVFQIYHIFVMFHEKTMENSLEFHILYFGNFLFSDLQA